MNKRNEEHTITIRTFKDGKIVNRTWYYSIRQCSKRNLVELRITMGKTDNSKQNQKSYYGSTEAEAVRKAKGELMKDFGFGQDADDGYTISAWLKKYIELNSRNWSYNATETNQSYARLYIDPIIGHHLLSEFTTKDFLLFYDTLKHAKNQSKAYKNTATDDTPFISTLYINKICYLLHSAFESAVDREIIVRNPVRTGMFDRANRNRTKALPKTLFRHFYAAIKDSPYKNFYLFVLATAERRNEAYAVRRCDIDENTIVLTLQYLRLKAGDKPHKDMIVIDTTLNKEGKIIYHVLVKPKWSSNREIFITPFVRALLDQQLARIASPRIQENNKKGFLFVNDEGKMYGESTIGKDLKKCLVNYRDTTGIDLTMYSLHSLRDTNASWLFGVNADNLVISRQLGHADVNITNARYRDYLHNEDAELGYLRKKIDLESFILKTIESIDADNNDT